MAACQVKNAQRLRYQNHRFERVPGMSLLLDAFALVDCGVAESIASRGEQPACGPGCCHCCTQPIPLTPLEILALRLFVELELPADKRDKLKAAFASFHGKRATLGDTCPFLLGGVLRRVSCASHCLPTLHRLRRALRQRGRPNPDPAC